MNKLFFPSVFLLILSFAIFVNADLITPGFDKVGVTSIITNAADVSKDYFLVMQSNIPNICPSGLLPEDGIIKPGYGNCRIDVYAVSKSKITLEDINSIKDYQSYIDSGEFTKVIDNISLGTSVPTGTSTGITNTYIIEIGKLKSNPDSTDSKISPLAIIVLVVIVAVIIAGLVFYFKKSSKRTTKA